MMHSLERLENGELFIQSVAQRLKHGAKGKVIFESYIHILNKIKNEND